MADLKYADRVAESTVSTGTGDINLAGAIDTDHATFGSQFADGDLMPVSVFGGGKWMTFIGRYNSGANSLTRITFRRSSTGANLSLSGTMTVLCGWTAEDAISVAVLAAAAVRFDAAQALTAAQLSQALANVGVTPDSGRLAYVSATAIKFAPFKGDLIKINGGVYQIPAAGIAGVANTGVFVNGTGASNLAASTVYYVYAFMNSGVMTADFSTMGHATSSTAGNVGIEIKSGDGTRTLIGMVATNASGQFQDSATFAGVATWFNRRSRQLVSTEVNNGASGAGIWYELSTSLRLTFLVWSDENWVAGTFSGSVTINGSGSTNVGSGMGIDGASPLPGSSFASMNNNNNNITAAIGGATGLSEGIHYLTALGGTNAIVVTYASMGTTATVRG